VGAIRSNLYSLSSCPHHIWSIFESKRGSHSLQLAAELCPELALGFIPFNLLSYKVVRYLPCFYASEEVALVKLLCTRYPVSETSCTAGALLRMKASLSEDSVGEIRKHPRIEREHFLILSLDKQSPTITSEGFLPID